MHFALYDQYGHILTHKNPCPRGHFSRAWLFCLLFVYNIYIVTSSARCTEIEKKRFKKYINFYQFYWFTPKLRLISKNNMTTWVTQVIKHIQKYGTTFFHLWSLQTYFVPWIADIQVCFRGILLDVQLVW